MAEDVINTTILRYCCNELEQIKALVVGNENRTILETINTALFKLKIVYSKPTIPSKSLVIEILTTFVVLIQIEKVPLHIFSKTLQSLRALLPYLHQDEYNCLLENAMNSLKKHSLEKDSQLLMERIYLYMEVIKTARIEDNELILTQCLKGLISIIIFCEENKLIKFGELACNCFFESWICLLQKICIENQHIIVILLHLLVDALNKCSYNTLLRSILAVIRTAVQFKCVTNTMNVKYIFVFQFFPSLLHFMNVSTLFSSNITTDAIITLNCFITFMYKDLVDGLETYVTILTTHLRNISIKYNEYFKSTPKTSEIFQLLIQNFSELAKIPNIASYLYYNYDCTAGRTSLLTMILSTVKILLLQNLPQTTLPLLTFLIHLISSNQNDQHYQDELKPNTSQIQQKHTIDLIAAETNKDITRAIGDYSKIGLGNKDDFVGFFRIVKGINKDNLTKFAIKQLKKNDRFLHELFNTFTFSKYNLLQSFWIVQDSFSIPQSKKERHLFLQIFINTYLQQNNMEINISEQESLVIFIQNALDLNQVIFKGNKSLSYKEFLLQQQKIYPNIENDLVTSFYYGMYIKDLHSTSSVFNPQQVTYDDYPNFLWTYPESSFIEFLLPFIKPLISSLIHKITDNHKTLIIVVRLLSQTSLLNYIIQLISSLITPPISQNSFNMLLCALITDITRKNFNQITVWGDVMKVICFIIDDGFIEPLVNTHLRRALRENKLESRNFQRDYLINAGVYDIMNSFCICDVNILTNIIQSILSLENSNLTINIIPKLINHILLSNVTRWESINQSILCLFEEILKTSSTLGCELSQVMFEFYLYLTKYPQQFNSCDKWFFSYLLHLPTTTLDYCRHVNVSILSILTKDHQISYESLKQIIIFLSINYSLHYSVVLRTILNYLSGEPKQNQTTPIQSSVKYNVMIKGQDKPQTYNEISTKKGLKLLMFLHDNTKNELKEDDEMMVLQTILKLMKITSIKELSKQFFPLLEEYFEFIINKQHNSEMLNQMFQTLFQISNGDIGKNNDGFYMNLLDLLKLKFFVTSVCFIMEI